MVLMDGQMDESIKREEDKNIIKSPRIIIHTHVGVSAPWRAPTSTQREEDVR